MILKLKIGGGLDLNAAPINDPDSHQVKSISDLRRATYRHGNVNAGTIHVKLPHFVGSVIRFDKDPHHRCDNDLSD